MSVVKSTFVYMLMEMLNLIGLYRKTCFFALCRVFAKPVTYYVVYPNLIHYSDCLGTVKCFRNRRVVVRGTSLA